MRPQTPDRSDPPISYRKYIARPVTFKIEMTRGCNLKCKFCPVHGMPELQNKYEFMHPRLLQTIARQLARLNPEGRIELTRRGEPTLNPDIVRNVSILREAMPNVQISLFTNGTELLRQRSMALALDLIDAGVNIFNIDCYNNTYDRFKAMAERDAAGVTLQDFRKFSAYKRHSGGFRLRVINLVPDIADPKETAKVRKIHNAAGNQDPQMSELFGIKPITKPLAKNCAKPFREMNVNWDGSVPICCEDWREQCILGKIPRDSAESIWYGKFHLSILRSLYAKDRSGVPCNKCSFSGGYYLGFLRNPNAEGPDEHLYSQSRALGS